MVTGNRCNGFQRMRQSAARRCLGLRSEEAFPEDDAVAVQQHYVVLAAVDDLLEVVLERLLGAVDDALQDDLLRGAIGRSAAAARACSRVGVCERRNCTLPGCITSPRT